MWSFLPEIRILYEKNQVLLYTVIQSDCVYALSRKSAICLALYMSLEKEDCLNAYNLMGEDIEAYENIERRYSKILVQDHLGLNVLEIKKIYSINDGKITYRSQFPITIQWIATYKCGFDCIYCGVNHKKINDDEEKVDATYVKKAFCEALEKGTQVFDIHGGDPLFQYEKRELFDIISLLCKKKCDVKLSTKSVITKEFALELKEIGLSYLQLSIDTKDANIEQKLYGKMVVNQYKRMLFSVKNLEEAHLSSMINIVVTKFNYKKIPELVTALLNTTNVKRISLAWYKKTINNDIDFQTTKVQKIWLIKKMEDIREQYKEKIFFDSNVDVKVPAKERIVCANGRYKLMIFPNGRCGVCDFIDRDKRFIAGNIKTQTIQEIWDSQEFIDITYQNKTLFKNTKCITCNCFEYCMQRGICYAEMLLKNNGSYGPDYKCGECII